MRHLICSILLVATLTTPSSSVFAESAMDIIESLKTEINFMERSLTAIKNESNQMKLYLQKVLANSETESALLKNRIVYLEAEYERVKGLKKKLEEDLNLLSASDDSLTNLKENYERGEKILEGQVRLWKIIGIGGVVIIIVLGTIVVIQAI